MIFSVEVAETSHNRKWLVIVANVTALLINLELIGCMANSIVS